MNRRQELQALFERTQADEAVILRRMAATARRRSRHVAAPATLAWGMAAVCLVAVVLWRVSLPSLRTSQGPNHRLAAEPFDARTVAPGEKVRVTRAPLTSAPVLAPDENESPAVKPASSRPGVGAEAHEISGPGAKHQEISTAARSERSPANWQAVAEALRNGNHEQARGLLDELTRSDDPEVRDGAELVRLRGALSEAGAQTVTQPPTPAQLERLDELARTGATSSIRASARKLLAEVRR